MQYEAWELSVNSIYKHPPCWWVVLVQRHELTEYNLAFYQKLTGMRKEMGKLHCNWGQYCGANYLQYGGSNELNLQ